MSSEPRAALSLRWHCSKGLTTHVYRTSSRHALVQRRRKKDLATSQHELCKNALKYAPSSNLRNRMKLWLDSLLSSIWTLKDRGDLIASRVSEQHGSKGHACWKPSSRGSSGDGCEKLPSHNAKSLRHLHPTTNATGCCRCHTCHRAVGRRTFEMRPMALGVPFSSTASSVLEWGGFLQSQHRMVQRREKGSFSQGKHEGRATRQKPRPVCCPGCGSENWPNPLKLLVGLPAPKEEHSGRHCAGLWATTPNLGSPKETRLAGKYRPKNGPKTVVCSVTTLMNASKAWRKICTYRSTRR